MSATQHKARLLQRIADRTAHMGIIGIGYVGLPLAMVFAEAGFKVIGIDVDANKVAQLNAGHSYVSDVPDQQLAAVREAGRFEATTDFSVIATLDAISICVPTPLNKTRDPDISSIINVTDALAHNLHPGQLIVLESTTYPGTTREVILPQLQAGGLVVGQDFFLAFSPERVDPGRQDWTTHNTPKVMGGVTKDCMEIAQAFYESAIERVIPVSSPEAAEMVKLIENTFRAVNIGLANEVLLMCDKLGLDAWEVVDAAATKPFGFMPFKPGPGLGGHCIPIDPLYLSWKMKTLDYTARFIELASEINTNMPRYWVQKVQDALNEHGRALKGSQVLVLGVAYKKDVTDVRESPALDILHLLSAKGAQVRYHDPFVPKIRIDELHLTSEHNLEAALHSADCVVVVTDHSSYDWQQVRALAALVVDTRAVLRGSESV